jgi:Uma2 family endonuclease
MSALPKRKLSRAEYLLIERKADFKSEFFDGEMFAMSGASLAHNRINENVSVEIGTQLKGGRCQSFSRDLRVSVDRTGLICYPDLVIVCGKVEPAGDDSDTITNPTVIIEILSDSTERYDRTTKLKHYRDIPSLREYVMIAQDEWRCERYHRLADGTWSHEFLIGPDAVLELTSAAVRVPFAEIFADVVFPGG